MALKGKIETALKDKSSAKKGNMKRSEMEQLVFEELLKAIPQEASLNLAKSILGVCLEAGMLPPNKQKREPDYETNMFLPIYEWEDE